MQVFHKATLLGVTSIFLVLIAKFLLEGVGGGGEGFVQSLGTEADAVKWQKTWALVAAGIVWFPVVFIRNMKEIAPLSAFGMLASLLCVVEIVAFAVVIQPVTAKAVHDYNLPVPQSFLNRTDIQQGGAVSYTLFTPTQFPVAFSAITLSFGVHAVFTDIEKHMKDAGNFDTTFNAAYVVLLVLYLMAAVFGFYTFGDITYSPVLCNFPRDTHSTLGMITATTKLLIAFHVMSAYPILMNVLVTEMERGFGLDEASSAADDNRHNSRKAKAGPALPLLEAGDGRQESDAGAAGASSTTCRNWQGFALRTLLRTCMVAITCCVAIFVPFFGLLMELVGALCLTMMVFVLPVVFSWQLWGDRMSAAQKVFGVFIVAVGSIGGLIGTVQALQDIAKSLAEGKHE